MFSRLVSRLLFIFSFVNSHLEIAKMSTFFFLAGSGEGDDFGGSGDADVKVVSICTGQIEGKELGCGFDKRLYKHGAVGR